MAVDHNVAETIILRLSVLQKGGNTKYHIKYDLVNDVLKTLWWLIKTKIEM